MCMINCSWMHAFPQIWNIWVLWVSYWLWSSKTLTEKLGKIYNVFYLPYLPESVISLFNKIITEVEGKTVLIWLNCEFTILLDLICWALYWTSDSEPLHSGFAWQFSMLEPFLILYSSVKIHLFLNEISAIDPTYWHQLHTFSLAKVVLEKVFKSVFLIMWPHWNKIFKWGPGFFVCLFVF